MLIAPNLKIYAMPIIFGWGLDFIIEITIETIAGIILGFSIGLMLHEESRFGGMIPLTLCIAIPVIYVMMFSNETANITQLFLLYLVGIFGGIVITAILILINRRKYISIGAKISIIALILISGIYLLFQMYMFYTTISDPNIRNLMVAGLIGFSFLCLGVICLIGKKIPSVTNFHVFIIGPKNSGKTHLSVALAAELKKRYHRFSPKVTSYPIKLNELKKDLWYLDIWSLEKDIKNGISRRTEPYELVIHTFTYKKYYLFPVVWRIVDYAGEFFDKICGNINLDDRYYKAISSLSNQLSMNEKKLMKIADSADLLTMIKNKDLGVNNGGKMITAEESVRNDIVAVTILANLSNADKIVFLLDGEKIFSNNKDDQDDIMKIFDCYRKLAVNFKPPKKIALVITKLDYIFSNNKLIRDRFSEKTGVSAENLDQIDDFGKHKKLINALEKIVYDAINDGHTPLSHAFTNMTSDIFKFPTHFITVTIDYTNRGRKTMQIIPQDDSPDSITARNFAPIGLDEIFEFAK